LICIGFGFDPFTTLLAYGAVDRTKGVSVDVSFALVFGAGSDGHFIKPIRRNPCDFYCGFNAYGRRADRDDVGEGPGRVVGGAQ
jgi:hypothetical protein